MSTSPVDVAPTRGVTSLRWLSSLVSSTVGAKFLVAVTGMLLTGFVLAHMLGNLQVFLGRDALNKYAHSLKQLGPLLWMARGGLLFVLIVHLFLALRLKKLSLDARPVRYQYARTIESTWVSRHMALTGLVVLAFLLFHLAHFTFGWFERVENTTAGEVTNYLDLKDPTFKDPLHPGEGRQDVYHMVIAGFRNVPISIFYIICQLALGAHLLHGTRSMFQSLGLNSVKFNAIISWLGLGVTAAVTAGNVVMPIAVVLRLVGSDVP